MTLIRRFVRWWNNSDQEEFLHEMEQGLVPYTVVPRPALFRETCADVMVSLPDELWCDFLHMLNTRWEDREDTNLYLSTVRALTTGRLYGLLSFAPVLFPRRYETP